MKLKRKHKQNVYAEWRRGAVESCTRAAFAEVHGVTEAQLDKIIKDGDTAAARGAL